MHVVAFIAADPRVSVLALQKAFNFLVMTLRADRGLFFDQPIRRINQTAARTARLHVYRAPWGGAAQGIYLHEHRHGAIVVAADGEQIAVVQKDGSKGDVVVYAPPSMSPIATTASWSDPCGTTNCTTTSEIMPAWARDIWPW